MACALLCHQIEAQADGHKETEMRTSGLGWSQNFTKGGAEGRFTGIGFSEHVHTKKVYSGCPGGSRSVDGDTFKVSASL
jgi:hypothetical protein